MRNERLKILREHLNITQQTMGEMVGLSKANIRDLESGKVKISTIHAIAFEHIFHINSAWLLTGEGPMFIKENIVSEGDLSSDIVNYETLVEAEHLKLIKQFKNKELAKNINSKLIELEQIAPEDLEEVDGYLDHKISFKKSAMQKKMTEQANWKGEDRRKNKAS